MILDLLQNAEDCISKGNASERHRQSGRKKKREARGG